MTSNFDWRRYLHACFASTEFCTLATADADAGVWSNPVYFAWDDDFTLYFISQPSSRHMQNIVRNGRVAMSIYSTRQSTFDDVCGVQLAGDAIVLVDPENVQRAYATYYGRKYPETGRNANGKNEDAYVNDPSWVFVRVTPRELSYFDTRFFDEERQAVPREIFSRDTV